MSFRFAMGLVLLTLCGGSHGVVLAQDQAATRSARTLFEQGLEQVDAREWGEAAISFRQALLLRDSAVIRYNLAVALIELHSLLEAEQLLRGLQRDLTTPVEVRAKLSSQLESIDRRAAKLTVRVDGATEPVEVVVDERVLADSELGVAQRLDPGPHTVRLRRGGQEVDTRHLELAEGVNELLVLSPPVVATPAEVAAQAVEPAPPRQTGPAVRARVTPTVQQVRNDESATKRRRRRWWGIGAGVVAVAAGGVTGAVLAARSSSSSKPYEGDFDPPVIGVRVPQ